ncbi:GTPase, partial [Microcystis aeruginosa]|uniref:GTPase n=1 Tax=Microcystis aeruginosa TaxID=1126 RepID=UPI000B08E11E
IDTAGIRETDDVVENIGIQKTFAKIEQAQVVLALVDGSQLSDERLTTEKIEIEKIRNQHPLKPLVIVINKSDLIATNQLVKYTALLTNNQQPNNNNIDLLTISAKTKEGIEQLKNTLLSFVNTGVLRNNETVVTNARHYDALLKALEEITKVKQGLTEGLSTDLLAIDIKQALYYFGEITGEVTND